MTFIGKRNTGAYAVEDRSWIWGPVGTAGGENPGVTLAADLFGSTLQKPAGVIPSGIVVAKVTSGPNTGLYGPADTEATDGREDATDVGHLFGSLEIPQGVTGAKLGGALYIKGYIRPVRLPFATGAGSATAAIRTALAQIDYRD